MMQQQRGGAKLRCPKGRGLKRKNGIRSNYTNLHPARSAICEDRGQGATGYPKGGSMVVTMLCLCAWGQPASHNHPDNHTKELKQP